MTIIPSLRWSGFVAVAALFAGLLATGEGQTRQPPAKQNKAAKVELKAKEVDILARAYVLMAGANHDYNGHRVKSMGHVHKAIEVLDRSILKDGTNGEKVVATNAEIAAARAKFAAEHQGIVHESQAFSDLLMKEARKLLTEAHQALAEHKQPKVHDRVGHALAENGIALKIR
jgi:hypothetical protein